jgi:hypothetical protein
MPEEAWLAHESTLRQRDPGSGADQSLATAAVMAEQSRS